MVYRCIDKERKIYLKKDSARALSDITRIVFDFDGVLVQTSQSYHQTIRKVVDHYFLEILDLEGEEGKLVTLGDIQEFKDTGLFNNDWNLSESVIIHYLSIVLRRLKQKHVLKNFTKRFSNIQFSELRSFLQILGEVGDFLRHHGINATDLVNTKNDNAVGLKSFLAEIKQNPLSDTLENVFPRVGSEKLTFIRKLAPYDLEKPDLLKRLFEESYLGAEIFNKFYGVPSIFKFNESFLEKETFIATKKTLEALSSRFGKLAIYSEKPRAQGMYILEKNDSREYFDEERSIFNEDLIKSEVDNETVTLGKPNPTLFIELIEKFVRNGGAAYVGDGIADVLLVENARLDGLSNVSFLGVLCSSQHPYKLFSRYMEHEAEAIMRDVNDIPRLLASLGGKI
jgi:phosphoglycolate phosphatase-like HAD superfamily hydrolase